MLAACDRYRHPRDSRLLRQVDVRGLCVLFVDSLGVDRVLLCRQAGLELF